MNTPKIVCLCGSTRFSATFRAANLRETLAGNIVLTVGCDTKSDTDLFGGKSPEEQAVIKANLDQLHLRKVEMADEVLILNVGGYIGESTKRELDHAYNLNKQLRYWMDENPDYQESEKTYAVYFSPPGTDEEGTPQGYELIEAILAQQPHADGYSYVAFGPQTRENLQDVAADLLAMMSDKEVENLLLAQGINLQALSESQERIQNLFLDKLAEKQPDHPWVKARIGEDAS